jgi:regulator of nucleoside diphosphate kinase
MKKPTIIITEADQNKLSRLIAAGGRSSRLRNEAHGLEEELARAEIIPPAEVPPDVITMNTRAELLDLDTGERMEFTVVFPGDANIDEGKISVLAPIGTGMLGYRVGDAFEQVAPTGVRRLKVMRVHFQPEAAFTRS